MHEFSHQLFCRIVGVRVFKVKYFQLKHPAGYVEHAQPRNFLQAFLISVGPLIIGTLLSLMLFWFIVYTINSGQINTTNLLTMFFAAWLGLAVSLNCFPSSGDAKVLLSEARHHIFQRFNPFALILFPFIWIIQLANYLKRFYLDWIYAIFLVFLSVWIYFMLKS